MYYTLTLSFITKDLILLPQHKSFLSSLPKHVIIFSHMEFPINLLISIGLHIVLLLNLQNHFIILHFYMVKFLYLHMPYLLYCQLLHCLHLVFLKHCFFDISIDQLVHLQFLIVNLLYILIFCHLVINYLL